MNRRDLMTFDFNRAPVLDRPRSTFDHSHRHLTTGDAGYLIPIFVKPVFPGDTFHLSEKIIVRLNGAMKFPMLDNLKIETHYFYGPGRILQDDFVNVMGESLTPMEVNTHHLMQTSHSDVSAVTHSIWDYFGSALGASMEGLLFNALPAHLYNQVINDFYIDQDIDTRLNENTDPAGGDPIGHYGLFRRRKRKDMYTSARPYPQASTTEVPITGLGNLPVFGNGKALGLVESTSATPELRFGLISNSSRTLGAITTAYGADAGAAPGAGDLTTADRVLGVIQKSQTGSANYANTGLYADATAGTLALQISTLRLAVAMQHVLELDQRGGHRYIESLLSQWGVVSSDVVQQRPEFLGGGMSFMDVNSVPATLTNATHFLGDLGAFAVGFQNNGGFHKSFEEHGYILGLISITADLLYDRGMEHFWHWYDRWDMYCPELANLSEMPIYNREIFVQNTAADLGVFGYHEAWVQERFSLNRVSGLFRSNPTSGSSLNAWHLGQVFTELPVLNSTFLQEDPPVDRIIQYPNLPHFMIDCFFDCKVSRVMPVHSRPGLLRF